MTQTDLRVLFPPLLLATDGSAGALLAQKVVRPLVQLFRAQVQEDGTTQAGITVEEAEFQSAEATQLAPSRSPQSPSSKTAGLLLMVLTVQPRVVKRLQRLGKKSASSSKTENLGEQGAPTEALAASSQADPGGIPSLDTVTASVQADFPNLTGIQMEMRQGRPTAEILNSARSIQAGLIAVGHRGTGGVRELLLGSVSTAIARYASCSVLIARTANPLTDEPTLNHVLLVVDESVGTRSAIAATRQLIPAGIQTITLLHVQSPLNANYLLGPFFSPTPSWQLNQSLQNAQKEQGMEVLQQATASLHGEHQVTISTRLQTGDAGPLICQIAQELQVNLIVLGSDATRRTLLAPLQARRSRQTTPDVPPDSRPIRNTRLSVTDDYVIHYAPCPVLLCRSTPAIAGVGSGRASV
jgi:nucleotide-binding universal stress UspA family protein